MFRLREDYSRRQQVAPKESYHVNLPLQQAECEANYYRIQKLLAGMQSDDYRFMVSRGSTQWLHHIQVIERSRYTTTLVLTLQSSQASEWLKMPRLTVRIYLDACLAEVLAWEGHKRLRPRYHYPNPAMYQTDEKLQINQFLGEWLKLCLEEGHSLDDVTLVLAD
ncbi:DUF1249 domain-containing protein [Cellvibrio japonicus]|uniref:Uvs098 n=1 Tax=Cellvibrio japonicus (strain Ueda107) TaxID=498211 RepID=B3PCJ8_CELJU|nr:DUF1249 domain-containing protein [Cellvibrio japonicus]ACE85341.1 Uvs098 [Cellvibrio japonicus Ueda107]QEI13229.1 DUF1249 domain-containing protein [Cellvibrio japonicus]QEI16803.1 DUF1249 domain-containing protein [Cellvibrio japonicus]QEI20381.1 DUF1249 domain-containing protein [Cellvibrio japonicus]